MNKTSFFGQDLWIQYAPEFETPEDVQFKLAGRRIAIQKRLDDLVIERPDEEIHEYKRKGRIPLERMTTSGLLGEEEAIPASDYIDLQVNKKFSQVNQSEETSQVNQSEETSQMTQSEAISQVNQGNNTQSSPLPSLTCRPLKPKRKKTLPVIQNREVGALREGERAREQVSSSLDHSTERHGDQGILCFRTHRKTSRSKCSCSSCQEEKAYLVYS